MNDEFRWGVKNGDLEKVRELLEKKGCDVNADLLNGRRPIHFAADYGQRDMVEYLANMGADLDLKDKHGITPLLAAIYEGHTECVRVLVTKGAKKDGKSPDGETYKELAETQEMRDLL